MQHAAVDARDSIASGHRVRVRCGEGEGAVRVVTG